MKTKQLISFLLALSMAFSGVFFSLAPLSKAQGIDESGFFSPTLEKYFQSYLDDLSQEGQPGLATAVDLANVKNLIFEEVDENNGLNFKQYEARLKQISDAFNEQPEATLFLETQLQLHWQAHYASRFWKFTHKKAEQRVMVANALAVAGLLIGTQSMSKVDSALSGIKTLIKSALLPPALSATGTILVNSASSDPVTYPPPALYFEHLSSSEAGLNEWVLEGYLDIAATAAGMGATVMIAATVAKATTQCLGKTGIAGGVVGLGATLLASYLISDGIDWTVHELREADLRRELIASAHALSIESKQKQVTAKLAVLLKRFMDSVRYLEAFYAKNLVPAFIEYMGLQEQADGYFSRGLIEQGQTIAQKANSVYGSAILEMQEEWDIKASQDFRRFEVLQTLRDINYEEASSRAQDYFSSSEDQILASVNVFCFKRSCQKDFKTYVEQMAQDNDTLLATELLSGKIVINPDQIAFQAAAFLRSLSHPMFDFEIEALMASVSIRQAIAEEMRP